MVLVGQMTQMDAAATVAALALSATATGMLAKAASKSVKSLGGCR